MGQPNRICMIYFSDSKKKVDKIQTKLLAKYKKNKAVTVDLIPTDKFTFKKPDSTY